MAGESTTMMRTLGIDLATSHSHTGVCEIDWADDGGPARTIVERSKTHHDDELVDRICDVLADDGWVGIDAPFGFPAAFTEAVGSWSDQRTVHTASGVDIAQRRGETGEIEGSWRWRATDRYVAEVLTSQRRCMGWGGGTRWGLSSVASMITPTALRCARLLTSVAQRRADKGAPLKPVDRLGADRVVEAYPVAALRLWLESDPTGTATLSRPKSGGTGERKSYKHSKGAREDLVEAIDAAAGAGALGIDDDSRTLLEESDDRIDALVCALVARLAALNLSVTELDAEAGINDHNVADEGWIHFPDRNDTLTSLF